MVEQPLSMDHGEYGDGPVIDLMDQPVTVDKTFPDPLVSNLRHYPADERLIGNGARYIQYLRCDGAGMEPGISCDIR
uniref:Uncharacterized protein n=1 Tax=Candidatus Kentrum sp. LPFa TaxID=2126335 RepID=A0A450WTC5_9GAMM|nr:MAG: hypothetical protein BECKLPF1236A_GA0070988_102547 [Candidatus Kentron sp. LPFa]VFK34290.1 MAG: hypothetical protein BECKLPF1236C_GA0070990_102577 [Candidatus Kentron sp. LPFa]